MIQKKDVLDILKDIHADVVENNWNGFETIHLVRGSVLGLAERNDFGDEAADFDVIERYVDGCDFSGEGDRQRLRGLWMAHCIKFDIDPDTGIYDGEIARLGGAIKKLPPRCRGMEQDWAETADWRRDDKDWTDWFDLYMGEFLA